MKFFGVLNSNSLFKNVSAELAQAISIEDEENQRELSERLMRRDFRDQDDFTEKQIRFVKLHSLNVPLPSVCPARSWFLETSHCILSHNYHKK